MYLTKLDLNLKNHITRKWLSNPYRVHQRLWMAFGEKNDKNPKDGAPFLFRLDMNSKTAPTRPRILVLSSKIPLWEKAFVDFAVLTHVPGNDDMRRVEPDKFIQTGNTFRFSLTANPTKKIKNYRSIFENELKDYPSEFTRAYHREYIEGKNKVKELIKTVSKEQRENLPSKRVGIYNEEEQIEWMKRKSEQHGFHLANLYINKGEITSAQKQANEENKSFQIFSVTFEGILKIIDPEKFKQAYINGIGSGKAFGFGMLLLAKA